MLLNATQQLRTGKDEKTEDYDYQIFPPKDSQNCRTFLITNSTTEELRLKYSN